MSSATYTSHGRGSVSLPLFQALATDRWEAAVKEALFCQLNSERNADGDTPLIFAARSNNTQKVVAILQRGVEVGLSNINTKETALTVAIDAGNKEMVERLVKKGAAKIKEAAGSALTRAVWKRHIGLVKYFVEEACVSCDSLSPNGQNILMIAARNADREMVEFILKKAAGAALLTSVCSSTKYEGDSAFTVAVRSNDTAIVDMMLPKVPLRTAVNLLCVDYFAKPKAAQLQVWDFYEKHHQDDIRGLIALKHMLDQVSKNVADQLVEFLSWKQPSSVFEDQLWDCPKKVKENLENFAKVFFKGDLFCVLVIGIVLKNSKESLTWSTFLLGANIPAEKQLSLEESKRLFRLALLASRSPGTTPRQFFELFFKALGKTVVPLECWEHLFLNCDSDARDLIAKKVVLFDKDKVKSFVEHVTAKGTGFNEKHAKLLVTSLCARTLESSFLLLLIGIILEKTPSAIGSELSKWLTSGWQDVVRKCNCVSKSSMTVQLAFRKLSVAKDVVCFSTNLRNKYTLLNCWWLFSKEEDKKYLSQLVAPLLVLTPKDEIKFVVATLSSLGEELAAQQLPEVCAREIKSATASERSCSLPRGIVSEFVNSISSNITANSLIFLLIEYYSRVCNFGADTSPSQARAFLTELVEKCQNVNAPACKKKALGVLFAHVFKKIAASTESDDQEFVLSNKTVFEEFAREDCIKEVFSRINSRIDKGDCSLAVIRKVNDPKAKEIDAFIEKNIKHLGNVLLTMERATGFTQQVALHSEFEKLTEREIRGAYDKLSECLMSSFTKDGVFSRELQRRFIVEFCCTAPEPNILASLETWADLYMKSGKASKNGVMTEVEGFILFVMEWHKKIIVSSLEVPQNMLMSIEEKIDPKSNTETLFNTLGSFFGVQTMDDLKTRIQLCAKTKQIELLFDTLVSHTLRKNCEDSIMITTLLQTKEQPYSVRERAFNQLSDEQQQALACCKDGNLQRIFEETKSCSILFSLCRHVEKSKLEELLRHQEGSVDATMIESILEVYDLVVALNSPHDSLKAVCDDVKSKLTGQLASNAQKKLRAAQRVASDVKQLLDEEAAESRGAKAEMTLKQLFEGGFQLQVKNENGKFELRFVKGGEIFQRLGSTELVLEFAACLRGAKKNKDNKLIQALLLSIDKAIVAHNYVSSLYRMGHPSLKIFPASEEDQLISIDKPDQHKQLRIIRNLKMMKDKWKKACAQLHRKEPRVLLYSPQQLAVLIRALIIQEPLLSACGKEVNSEQLKPANSETEDEEKPKEIREFTPEEPKTEESNEFDADSNVLRLESVRSLLVGHRAPAAVDVVALRAKFKRECDGLGRIDANPMEHLMLLAMVLKDVYEGGNDGTEVREVRPVGLCLDPKQCPNKSTVKVHKFGRSMHDATAMMAQVGGLFASHDFVEEKRFHELVYVTEESDLMEAEIWVERWEHFGGSIVVVISEDAWKRNRVVVEHVLYSITKQVKHFRGREFLVCCQGFEPHLKFSDLPLLEIIPDPDYFRRTSIANSTAIFSNSFGTGKSAYCMSQCKTALHLGDDTRHVVKELQAGMLQPEPSVWINPSEKMLDPLLLFNGPLDFHMLTYSMCNEGVVQQGTDVVVIPSNTKVLIEQPYLPSQDPQISGGGVCQMIAMHTKRNNDTCISVDSTKLRRSTEVDFVWFLAKLREETPENDLEHFNRRFEELLGFKGENFDPSMAMISISCLGDTMEMQPLCELLRQYKVEDSYEKMNIFVSHIAMFFKQLLLGPYHVFTGQHYLARLFDVFAAQAASFSKTVGGAKTITSSDFESLPNKCYTFLAGGQLFTWTGREFFDNDEVLKRICKPTTSPARLVDFVSGANVVGGVVLTTEQKQEKQRRLFSFLFDVRTRWSSLNDAVQRVEQVVTDVCVDKFGEHRNPFHVTPIVMIRAVYTLVRMYAHVPVIFQGEPGVGKSRLAEFLAAVLREKLAADLQLAVSNVICDALRSIYLDTESWAKFQIPFCRLKSEQQNELKIENESTLRTLQRTLPNSGNENDFSQIMLDALQKAVNKAGEVVLPVVDESVRQHYARIEAQFPILGFPTVPAPGTSTIEIVRQLSSLRFHSRYRRRGTFSKQLLHPNLAPSEQLAAIRADSEVLELARRCDINSPAILPDFFLLSLFFDEVNTSLFMGQQIQMLCNGVLAGHNLPACATMLCALNAYTDLEAKSRTNKDYRLLMRKFYVNPVPEALKRYMITFAQPDRGEQEEMDQLLLKSKMDLMRCKEQRDQSSQGEGEKIKEISEEDKKINELLLTQNEIEMVTRVIFKAMTKFKEIAPDRVVSNRNKFHIMQFLKGQIAVLHTSLRCNSSWKGEYRTLKLKLISSSFVFAALRKLTTAEQQKEFAEFLTRAWQEEASPDDAAILGESLKNANEVSSLVINERNVPLKELQIIRTPFVEEYLYELLVCFLERIPITLLNEAGAGKTMCVRCLVDLMRGSESHSKFFSSFPALDLIMLLGSPNTTSSFIFDTFTRAVNVQEKCKESTIIVVMYDEAGLPATSPANKALHSFLDHRKVATVCLTNDLLDPANENRMVTVCIAMAKEQSQKAIARSLLPNVGDAVVTGLVKGMEAWLSRPESSSKESLSAFNPRAFQFLLSSMNAHYETTYNQPFALQHALLKALVVNCSAMPRNELELASTCFFSAIEDEVSGEEKAAWETVRIPLRQHLDDLVTEEFVWDMISADRTLVKDAEGDRAVCSRRFLLIVLENDDPSSFKEYQKQHEKFFADFEEFFIFDDFPGDTANHRNATTLYELRDVVEGGKKALVFNCGSCLPAFFDIGNRHPRKIPKTVEVINEKGEKVKETRNQLTGVIPIGGISSKCSIHPDTVYIFVMSRSSMEIASVPLLSRCEMLMLKPPSISRDSVAALVKAVVVDFVSRLVLSGKGIVGFVEESTVHSLCQNDDTNAFAVDFSRIPEKDHQAIVEKIVSLCQVMSARCVLSVNSAVASDLGISPRSVFFDHQEHFSFSRLVKLWKKGKLSKSKLFFLMTHDSSSFNQVRFEEVDEYLTIDVASFSRRLDFTNFVSHEVLSASKPILVVADSLGLFFSDTVDEMAGVPEGSEAAKARAAAKKEEECHGVEFISFVRHVIEQARSTCIEMRLPVPFIALAVLLHENKVSYPAIFSTLWHPLYMDTLVPPSPLADLLSTSGVEPLIDYLAEASAASTFVHRTDGIEQQQQEEQEEEEEEEEKLVEPNVEAAAKFYSGTATIEERKSALLWALQYPCVQQVVLPQNPDVFRQIAELMAADESDGCCCCESFAQKFVVQVKKSTALLQALRKFELLVENFGLLALARHDKMAAVASLLAVTVKESNFTITWSRVPQCAFNPFLTRAIVDFFSGNVATTTDDIFQKGPLQAMLRLISKGYTQFDLEDYEMFCGDMCSWAVRNGEEGEEVFLTSEEATALETFVLERRIDDGSNCRYLRLAVDLAVAAAVPSHPLWKEYHHKHQQQKEEGPTPPTSSIIEALFNKLLFCAATSASVAPPCSTINAMIALELKLIPDKQSAEKFLAAVFDACRIVVESQPSDLDLNELDVELVDVMALLAHTTGKNKSREKLAQLLQQIEKDLPLSNVMGLKPSSLFTTILDGAFSTVSRFTDGDVGQCELFQKKGILNDIGKGGVAQWNQVDGLLSAMLQQGRRPSATAATALHKETSLFVRAAIGGREDSGEADRGFFGDRRNNSIVSEFKQACQLASNETVEQAPENDDEDGLLQRLVGNAICRLFTFGAFRHSLSEIAACGPRQLWSVIECRDEIIAKRRQEDNEDEEQHQQEEIDQKNTKNRNDKHDHRKLATTEEHEDRDDLRTVANESIERAEETEGGEEKREENKLPAATAVVQGDDEKQRRRQREKSNSGGRAVSSYHSSKGLGFELQGTIGDVSSYHSATSYPLKNKDGNQHQSEPQPQPQAGAPTATTTTTSVADDQYDMMSIV